METAVNQQLAPAEQPPKLPAIQAGGAVRAIVPQDFDAAWRIANAVVKSGMAPKGVDTAEKAMVAIMHGLEVGMTPMTALQSIAPINGRPAIWGDGALGLVQASGLLEWHKEYYTGTPGKDEYAAICEVKRKGDPEVKKGEFSIADAKQAQLYGKPGPWQQYTKRMLKMRARAFALRDGFSDVLRGLHIAEEAQDIPMRDVTPSGPPAPPPAIAAPPVQPVQDDVALVEAGASDPTEVEWVDDEPKPPAADDLEIPEHLRRTPKTIEAKAEEAFDEAQWLKDVEGALTGCEDTDTLMKIQNEVQKPAKPKVSAEGYKRSAVMVSKAFDRITNGDLLAAG
jgi:hypothetical protein